MSKENSKTKTPWEARADCAIEKARSMPPGPARHDAMKKAGLLRYLAVLMQEIERRERPVRGKKSRRPRIK